MEIKKATPVTTLSTMLVVIASGYPDVRFTPSGKSVAVFEAVGLTGITFELWQPAYVDVHDLKSPINELVSLPENAAIEVTGHAYVDTYKSKHGVSKKRNRFIINTWKKGWS